MSDLNIAEHRLPQDGRFKVKLSGREVDFRVSILPSSFGEKVAIRILDKNQAMLDIGKLGFSENTVSVLKKISKLPHGMMLVCGPTGSGKTTTLYSLLKFLDSSEKNIVTVEDPVEYQLEGINQVTARPEIGLTFAASLRSILRTRTQYNHDRRDPRLRNSGYSHKERFDRASCPFNPAYYYSSRFHRAPY